jgi:hypothetical protein
MRTLLLASLLVLGITGCMSTLPPSREAATAAQMKTRGPDIIIVKKPRTYYFENRLPHCLAYSLSGEWDFATQEAALRTPDGRHFVGIQLWDAQRLPGSSEIDPISRAVVYLQADAEKDFAQKVPITVEPFSSALPGAVLVRFEKVLLTPQAAARALGPIRPKSGELVGLPLRAIVPYPPGLVVILITTWDEDDAREVLATFEMTDDPLCWQSAIRERFPGLRVTIRP